MTHAPESFFLQQLFLRLNKSGIRYAVMRNYETLPYSAGGSNLDLVVHPEDEDRVRVVIAEAISMAGGVAIGYANTIGFFKIFSFGRGKLDADEWWGLRLDISVGFRYAGVAALVDDDVLNNRFFVHNGIRILSNDLGAVLCVVKELLYNNVLSARYLSAASKAVNINWDLLRVDLSVMSGSALALVRELCLSTSAAPDIAEKSRAFRRAILRTTFFRTPQNYLRFRFLHAWSKIRRYISPSGVVVSILGTDGAGKSTIISAIEPTLSTAARGAFIVKHLRPGLLPPLARLKGKQAPQDGPVTDPHGSNPSGEIGSLLRIIYLMIDYVLGYWLVVRPKTAKSPTIFLFDRYAYDMALDPRRFRIALPTRIIRWFTRLAPKPDLIFCLYGSPEVIAARKQELPLEEVRRQVDALKAFAATESRAILISTEATVNEARDQVLSAIAEHCEKRVRNTLRGD